MSAKVDSRAADKATPVKKLFHLHCVCERPLAVCGKPFSGTRKNVIGPPVEDRCVVCQELWICDDCRGVA